ncbi:Anaphase-promoting complex subunit 5 [Borealophlyctis nickersoniae]|nr:Anaphase-promoting complex subunit 5 [Borealophlyctis nickersoniae]
MLPHLDLPPDVDVNLPPLQDDGPISTTLLTPHKLAVIILIRLFVEYKHDSSDPVAVANFGSLLLELIEPPEPRFIYGREPTLQRLYERLETIGNFEDKNLVQHLNEELGRLLEMPDNLIDFFYPNPREHDIDAEEDADDWFEEFKKESPFGVFFRRLRLDFHQMMRQCDKLQTFYLGACCEFSMSVPTIFSELDVERFIDHQVKLLEGVGVGATGVQTKAILQNFFPYPEGGPECPTPKQLQKDLTQIRSVMPHIPKADYATYLNCLRVKDLEGAQEALTRYFAYVHKRHKSDDGREWYAQPALLLCTVVMYMHFNHMDLAKKTLEEAIIVARNSGDQKCLNQLQSLSNKLSPASTEGKNVTLAQRKIFASLISGAKEEEQYDLVAMAELDKVKLDLQTGQNPKEVFAGLQRARAYIVSHKLDELRGASNLLTSYAWETYGNSTLARLYGKMEGNLSKTCGPSDRVDALCNIAINLMESEITVSRHELQSAEEYALHYAALAENGGDLWVHGEFQQAKLERMRRRPTEARARLHRVIDVAKKKGPGVHRLTFPFYLELADMQMDSNNPLGALPHILSCISLATDHHMHLLVHQATVALSEVTSHLGDHVKSVDVLRPVMPNILAHGDLLTRSNALMVFAECLAVWVAADGEKAGVDVGAERRAAVGMLEKALEGFRKLDHLNGQCKTLCLLSLQHRDLGNQEERQRYASEYRAVDGQIARRERAGPMRDIENTILEEGMSFERFLEECE